jgi:hypothetical protein
VRYRPDMVVQTVSGQRLPAIPGSCPEHLACPVIENSRLDTVAPTLQRRLIATAKNLGIVFYGYYAYQGILGLVSSEPPPVGRDAAGMQSPEGEDLGGEADYERLSENFAAYERTIARILGPHVPVVFLFVPTSFVVHPGDAARWSHLLQADPMSARERIRADVAALSARGHPIIDTTDALIERADEERLYYWLDVHPTPAGNRVVAETAAPVLRERLEALQARDGAPVPAAPPASSAMRLVPTD